MTFTSRNGSGSRQWASWRTMLMWRQRQRPATLSCRLAVRWGSINSYIGPLPLPLLDVCGLTATLFVYQSNADKLQLETNTPVLSSIGIHHMNHLTCTKCCLYVRHFFLHTLGYKSDKVITCLMQSCGPNILSPGPSKRGRHKPPNCVDESVIISHINSYNPQISHYRRENAPRQHYLPYSWTWMFINYVKWVYQNASDIKIF